MSSDESVIVVDGVYKDFNLPHLRKNTIKSRFTGMFDSSAKHKGSETQHALKDISFEIKKGEFFGIVGRNGSGKSTLLKILAGIYQPTKGVVKTKGRLVPFIELGVGFNTELTGRENVFLNGSLLGFSKSEIDAMYDEIVEFAELERFMDQKLKNYSSGMQVRLAFSMAIRADADILLIDEVLAVGDADFQRKCFSYFKQLKKNKKTVVFVTHDMGAVREYCQRVILIDDSKIMARGDAPEISMKYTRLFQDSENKQDDKQKKERWGNGKLLFRKVSLEKDVITEKDREIKIHMELEATTNLDGPIIGFMLKDESGQPITGTNTKLQEVALGNIKKGQRLSLSWEMPCILSDGNYTIDAAATEDDSITICEWWENALLLKVLKSDHLPYAISPEFKLEYQINRARSSDD